jgi:hypothetical protein
VTARRTATPRHVTSIRFFAMDDQDTQAQPPMPSLMAGLGDGCRSCGAPLAGDQRYCLSCGERVGVHRVAVMDGRSPAPGATEMAAASLPAAGARPPRSSGTVLVAGVGTLLLAMGVGVLIGRSGETTPKAAAAPPAQVITVNGGGAGAASTPTSTDATGTTSTKKSSSKGTSTTGATELDKAAAKSGVKLPPKGAALGSKGSGKGYKNGKFTGDFFGD